MACCSLAVRIAGTTAAAIVVVVVDVVVSRLQLGGRGLLSAADGIARVPVHEVAGGA